MSSNDNQSPQLHWINNYSEKVSCPGVDKSRGAESEVDLEVSDNEEVKPTTRRP